MSDLADAFIALPGGYGTLEEFCEVLTWSQLGLQKKPCGLLNVCGYYDALLSMFDHAQQEGFVKPEHREMVASDEDPEKLVAALRRARVPSVKSGPTYRSSSSVCCHENVNVVLSIREVGVVLANKDLLVTRGQNQSHVYYSPQFSCRRRPGGSDPS